MVIQIEFNGYTLYITDIEKLGRREMSKLKEVPVYEPSELEKQHMEIFGEGDKTTHQRDGLPIRPHTRNYIRTYVTYNAFDPPPSTIKHD